MNTTDSELISLKCQHLFQIRDEIRFQIVEQETQQLQKNETFKKGGPNRRRIKMASQLPEISIVVGGRAKPEYHEVLESIVALQVPELQQLSPMLNELRKNGINKKP